jgi:hypothetical protein
MSRVVRGSQAARVERLLAEVAKVVAAEVAA